MNRNSAVDLNDTADLIWGAANIGAVIRRTARQTFYLHEKGLIPTRSVGRQLVASKRKLLAHLAGEEVSAA